MQLIRIFEKENLIMEDEKNVLEKWLEFREEGLECELNKKIKSICITLKNVQIW